jgi:hypothetical protein
MKRLAHRYTLVSLIAVAAIAALGACIATEDPTVSEDVAAATCATIDRTAPELAAKLVNAELTPASSIATQYKEGTKIASQTFRTSVDGSLVKLTCTSSCNGNWCSGTGCDPFGSNCSHYSCSTGCTGSCTKTVTAED